MKQDLLAKILQRAVDIQQIPAPTFGEHTRAEYVLDAFISEGLAHVSIDPIGNVIACLPGQGTAPPLVVSAHLDTVFPLDTDLNLVRDGEYIHGPGIGDNAVGVAGLFGLLWNIQQQGAVLPGDVWLIANVCEEGLGDLRGMQAVVDRFGDEVKAYVILEGMALGQIYHRGLSVTRYRISLHTKGGHSWADYGQPSAVHEIGRLIHKITSIKVPETPRSTVNVGIVAGGTSINTIADHAVMEVDLRSTDEWMLDQLVGEVQVISKASQWNGLQVQLELIGKRPAGSISPQHPLVLLAIDCLDAMNIEPYLNIGSTDANIPLSRGIPAVCIGLTTGAGAHTLDEYINTRPLTLGMEQLLRLVVRIFRV